MAERQEETNRHTQEQTIIEKMGKTILLHLPHRPLCSLSSLTAPGNRSVVPKLCCALNHLGSLKKYPSLVFTP